MGARVIPDQSGGQLRWEISRSGMRSHVFNLHVAPFAAGTGVFSTVPTDGLLDVYMAAHAIFPELQLYWDTSTSIQFAGAFPVVAGVVSPLSSVDPAGTGLTVSGSGTQGGTNMLGAQTTYTLHDDAGNLARLVFLDVAPAAWDPAARQNLIPAVTVGAGPIQFVDILTGFVSGAPNNTTPFQSHAGGKLQGPITATSTLNSRLRRDYGEK